MRKRIHVFVLAHDGMQLIARAHRAGFLGSLSLDIPWSNLQGRPTLVQIDHVFLIAAPKAATEV